MPYQLSYMNTSPIKCKNPRLIVYPILKSIWPAVDTIFNSRTGQCWNNLHYNISNQFLLYTCPWKPTVHNASDFFVTTKAGSVFPLYVVVPCNDCILCQQRRANEWSIRCIAENTLSITRPVFVTLTYRDGEIPDSLLSKRDIQLFLKRLRINLERKYNCDINLRYFLCAEYGKKTLRPHYHVIFWNWPIQYASLASVHADLHRAWQHGFVYVSNPDNAESRKKSCIAYATKYMRKGCPKPTRDCEDPFFLYSRRPGLGMGYIIKHLDFYRNTPEVRTISITDPYSGITMTTSIPQAWRSKIHPSVSKLIPKEIRDAYGTLVNIYTSLQKYGSYIATSLLQRINPILKKFEPISDYLVTSVIDSPTLEFAPDDLPFNFTPGTSRLFIEQFIETLERYELDEYLLNLSVEISMKKVDLLIDSVPMQYNLDYLTEKAKYISKKIEEKEIF